MSNQIFGEVGLVGEQYGNQRFGVEIRVQVPWAYFPLNGVVALPVAALRQDSEFWVGWAERAATDALVDLGLQEIFDPIVNRPHTALFLSFSTATRVFPGLAPASE